ncbi:hypothetical protein [Haloarcula sp. JP-L23]|uniref:hypothetical protein n=1 Tax=Haloarcula sp. JP-L23 TaxID=2716717 RepID=UPI00140EBACC|nr:hypothetical protein G9465_18010 [Haloarcula sp. JP-L23]
MSEYSYDWFHRTFRDIEEDIGLFDLRVDDTLVWERLRFPVHQQIRNSLVHADSSGGTDYAGTPLAARLGRVGTALTRRNPFLTSPRDTLVWGHNRRKFREDGQYWDIYCDPLYDRLDTSYLHLENPHKGTHYRPAKTDQLRYMDGLHTASSLYERVSHADVSLSRSQRRLCRRATERFAAAFAVDIDIERRVRTAVAERRATKPFYGALLDWHNPSLVVVVVSYGKETFVEACKERDIPVAELQHGVVTPFHYGYSYPGSRTKATFPDLFLTFGEFWADSVEFPTDTTVEPVGYPFLEQGVKRTADTDRRNRVVFVSQCSIGASLSEVAVAFDDLTDMEVVYKLHPEEYTVWRDNYPWLQSSSVDVIADDGPTLYDLFATSQAQVGVYSTALFEGVRFGLATYVLTEPGMEYVRSLLDAGAATAVDSVEELAAAVAEGTHGGIDVPYFFEPNPLANIERALADARR